MPKYTYQDRAGFMVVEEGDYLVAVSGYEFKISKAGGHDMIELTCCVEPHGNNVFERLVFTDKALWKIDQVLKALGIAPKKGEDVDFSEDWCKQHLLMKRAWVHLVKDEYEPGKVNNKIAFWITNKPVPPDELDQPMTGAQVADEVRRQKDDEDF